MDEGQMASMEVWERIPATEQVEIITRATKRAAYVAGVYGVTITPDELIGETWIGTVKRLDTDKLCKANTKRAAEDKAPLTIGQIAFRAAHSGEGLTISPHSQERDNAHKKSHHYIKERLIHLEYQRQHDSQFRRF